MTRRSPIFLAPLLLFVVGCDYVDQAGSLKETWAESSAGPFGLDERVCEGPNGHERNGCFQAAANLTRDSSYCTRIHEPQRASCLRQLASSTGNPDFCLEMKTPGACLVELAVNTGRHDVCDRAPESDFVMCVEALAAATGDPKVCEKNERELARDHCWIIVARAREEQPLCKFIKDSELRGRCNAQFVTVTLDPVGTCGLSDMKLADECFAEAALANPMHCARVRESRRQECYERAAREGLGQPSACAQLPTGQSLECFAQLATHRREPDICDEIEGPQARDVCRVHVAEALVDSQSCLVVSQPYRAPCARAIYARAQDPRLCQLLSGRDREACVKAL